MLLVDLEFKNTPREKAHRAFKAKLKPFRHVQQAKVAQENENWYAATFHRAWVLKAKYKPTESFDLFKKAYSKRESEYEQADKNLSKILPPIVTEMLKLPRAAE